MNPGAMAEIERLAERARNQVLDEIANDARRYAPVDTGDLVASIHSDHSSGEVIAEAGHAVYVELGTENMRAQPYLRPALYRKRHIRGDGG